MFDKYVNKLNYNVVDYNYCIKCIDSELTKQQLVDFINNLKFINNDGKFLFNSEYEKDYENVVKLYGYANIVASINEWKQQQIKQYTQELQPMDEGEYMKHPELRNNTFFELFNNIDESMMSRKKDYFIIDTEVIHNMLKTFVNEPSLSLTDLYIKARGVLLTIGIHHTRISQFNHEMYFIFVKSYDTFKRWMNNY